MTPEERKTIARWRHARTVSAGLRERATIIALAADGWHAPTIAVEMHLDDETARRWIKRFNKQGIEGLKERPHSGRPAVYSQEEVSLAIHTALTDPQTLDLPFASWTLDRLVTYLKEAKGLQMKRSRLGELLQAEGLRLSERGTLVWGASRSRLRRKKGAITTLSIQPPTYSIVICRDEMGPEAAKSHPGQRLVIQMHLYGDGWRMPTIGCQGNDRASG